MATVTGRQEPTDEADEPETNGPAPGAVTLDKAVTPTDASAAASAGTPGAPLAKPRRHGRWLMPTLLVLLLGTCVVSAGVGAFDIPFDQVVYSALHHMGIDVGTVAPTNEAVLWNIRFPRVVLGILVGACLGCAGAAMQGVFGNPLAEPGVIGVSSGAAVGAGAVIVLGGAFVAAWSVALAAFVAGLITTMLVYVLARADGRTEVVTLVLTGVAINAFAGGLIAFLLFVASPAARDQIVFWQLGSLNGATWEAVGVVAVLTVCGVLAAALVASRLDLLALGESAARHLGVDVERLRRTVIVIVAVLATAGVAFTGIIMFVGLIVPHVVRMVVGPGHRVLIPLSAIVGAVVLLAADVGARSLVDNADLPLGMLTSLVGGPFFFWLLRRTRARSGGWG